MSDRTANRTIAGLLDDQQAIRAKHECHKDENVSLDMGTHHK